MALTLLSLVEGSENVPKNTKIVSILCYYKSPTGAGHFIRDSDIKTQNTTITTCTIYSTCNQRCNPKNEVDNEVTKWLDARHSTI